MDHFLHCSLTVELWSGFLKEFGLYWVSPCQCKTLLQLDTGFHGKGGRKKKLWNAAIMAISWSLWLERILEFLKIWWGN